MKTIKQTQSGLSLIELMISIAVGLLLLAGVVSIYSNSVSSNSDALRTAKLNQDMRAIMLMMVNDIRRAGYNGSAAADVGGGAAANPFENIDTSTTGCILFQYDLTPFDGIVSTDEQFGYRLNDGKVESRAAGATCNGSGWQALSDTNTVTITALTFVSGTQNVNGPDNNADGTPDLVLTIRTITITLTGQLTNDATVTRTLTQQVRVRNDLLT